MEDAGLPTTGSGGLWAGGGLWVNGIHDLGGMDGLGPIRPTPAEPPFAHDWQKRVFAMFVPVALAGMNLEEFRFGMEQMSAAEYLGTGYYEHWLHSLERALLSLGTVSAEELDARTNHYLADPDAPLPEDRSPGLADQVLALLRAGGSTARPTDEPPRYAVGDRVRVRNVNPVGHTRAARYVRGRAGTITRWHGSFVFPDSNAVRGGENPTHVYNVQFEAPELWGEVDCDDNLVIRFDVWEPYLTAA